MTFPQKTSFLKDVFFGNVQTYYFMLESKTPNK